MTGPVAAYQQGAQYSAHADRDLLTSLVYRKLVGDESLAIDGVLYGGPVGNLADYQPSGWHTTVERGRAIVGGYIVTVPQSVTLTHDAATTTARRDLVILRVRDQEEGDNEDSAVVEIVKGSSTADPTVPPRSLVLGAVNIRASSSSIVAGDLDDRRIFTAANGGMIAADLSRSVLRPVSAPAGAIVYDYAHDTHHRKTAQGGYVPLSPPPHAIYFNNGYRIAEDQVWGTGPLQKHGRSLGDTSFVSVTNIQRLTVHEDAIYHVDWHYKASLVAPTGNWGWIEIYWPGMPGNIQAAISSDTANLAFTCLISPVTEIDFRVRSFTGGLPYTNNLITITRLS